MGDDPALWHILRLAGYSPGTRISSICRPSQSLSAFGSSSSEEEILQTGDQQVTTPTRDLAHVGSGWPVIGNFRHVLPAPRKL